MRVFTLMTLLIALAAANLYFLATTKLWLWAILFGVLYPAFAVWDIRRTANVGYANKLLTWLSVGQVGVLLLSFDRAAAREESLRRGESGDVGFLSGPDLEPAPYSPPRDDGESR